SSVDFLMSDGEDEGSFLSLPAATFSQRPSLNAELNNTNSSHHQLLIKVNSPAGGGRLLQPTQHSDCFSRLEEEQLVLRLRTQVKELEEKLLDQTREAERLRSELELKSCRSSEFQKLDAVAGSCSCSRCPRTQEVEALRREVSHWESQARQREQQLAELGQELQEKSCRVEAMQQQLDDSKRQLEDSRKRRADGEHNLHLRLQECEEELARRAATPPRVKVKKCWSGVRMNLLSLQPALRTLTSDYNCLKKQVQDFPSMLDKAISEAKQEICQVISDVSSTNQELLRKYKREMNLRKKCHNELVRLKGLT
ncbi:hypothetical protein XENOCAPTIV_013563, partial [Xenoophorus captivus]